MVGCAGCGSICRAESLGYGRRCSYFKGGGRGKPSDRSLAKRMRYWNYIIGTWLGYSTLVHAYYSIYAYFSLLTIFGRGLLSRDRESPRRRSRLKLRL